MAIDPQKLTQAVVHWLEYESAIGRSDLFDEAYLAFPLGNYLQVHGGGRVRPEALHPVLNKGNKGKGRRAAVDFVITPTGSDLWEWAIETKFIVANRDFCQEVFDDILRLECIVEDFKAARYLLVIAGSASQIHALLVNRSGQVGGGGNMQPLFPSVLSVDLNTPELTVEVEASTEPQRTYWKDAKHDRMGGWPAKLTTKLLGISGEVSPNGSGFSCLVWEVIPATRPLIQVN